MEYGLVKTILSYTAIIVSGVGICVIVYGVIIAIIELIQLETLHARKYNICKRREHIRHHFGSYLLFGLEILIAADVIYTVLEPTLRELAVLGSIVAIRTVLNVFLNRELGSASHTCDVDPARSS